MRRCVIVCGADILRPDELRGYFRDGDYFIYCDSGLRHIAALGREPDLIIGDFDSHPNPHSAVETIVLPHVKDDTDSFFAAKEALRRGFDEFLLVGALGARIDHSLGNLAILLMLDSAGKRAMIVDDWSELEIVSRSPAEVSDRFEYFSLLNVSGLARGVDVENARYPLRGAEISCEYPLGVSNEPLPGGARVRVGEGRLLLVRVWPEKKREG